MYLPTLLLAAVLASGCAEAGADRAPITVSAAASLTDALERIARAYERGGGGPVHFNLAGSNVLARQVASGAPVDVFISADEAQMTIARSSGAIDETSIVNLIGNRLAVVTARGRGASVPDLRALVGSVPRLAIGDPAAVPAGVYARKYLESTGVWPEIEGRVVPVGNVRAALSAVVSGAADAAIVYESDTITGSPVDVAFVVADPLAPPIVYPAALVKASRSKPAAARFLAYLQGPAAAAIFREHKFVPLTQ